MTNVEIATIKFLKEITDHEYEGWLTTPQYQAVHDAIDLLKEYEALLNKACETIADMDFECFCDDLMCDDGWCEENCKTSGTQPECIERWLRKQVEQADVERKDDENDYN